jgi:uncharacterized membrane protein YgcG
MRFRKKRAIFMARVAPVFLLLFCVSCAYFSQEPSQDAIPDEIAGPAHSGNWGESELPSLELRDDLSKLKPRGYISDFGDYLSSEEVGRLENLAEEIKNESEVDIAVVLVRTTGQHSLEEYSLHLARDWKIGSANGGALIMLAVEDREWRIQIDRSLEGLFTNDEIKQIGETMLPELKRNNYGKGLERCILEFSAEIRNKQTELLIK